MAPGECTLCHPPTFELKPASHEPDRYLFPKGHAEARRGRARRSRRGQGRGSLGEASGEAARRRKRPRRMAGALEAIPSRR